MRRPAHGSRSQLIGETGQKMSARECPTSTKKMSREKACFFWLLMLYYKQSRLNGLGSPFGIPPKMWGEGGKEAKDNRKEALKTFLESKQALLQEQPHQLGALLL